MAKVIIDGQEVGVVSIGDITDSKAPVTPPKYDGRNIESKTWTIKGKIEVMESFIKFGVMDGKFVCVISHNDEILHAELNKEQATELIDELSKFVNDDK